MTSQCLHIALQAFNRRRPFQPFTIEFVNGQRLTVTHPEAVRPRPTWVVFISPRGEHEFFDHASVCRVLDTPVGGAG